MRARRFRRPLLIALGVLVALVGGSCAFVYLAPFPSLESRLQPAGTAVLAADGTVLQRDTAAGIRIHVPLEAIAPILVQATIAAEDQRFDDHPGVDPVAMGREALSIFDSPSGASTITQQLARRLYLDGGGGPLPVRKAREAVLALRIEAHNSKDAILEAYLNAIYYGRGAYGIEAAARVYFGLSAQNLDLAHAAFLTGLPQLPAVYADDGSLDGARERQAYVLGRLRAEGVITPAEEAAALATEIAILPDLAPPVAPHFVAEVRAELARVRPDLAGRPGLVIETTLDAGLQQEAERIVAVQLDALRDRDARNAAVVVLDPRTGAVLALVGNNGPDAPAAEVNLALALRQPGSALKPFLYAAALEGGYTAASMLLDVPTTFETPEGPYTPGNYDRRFHGPVSLRTALASSFNVPAVRTLDAIGLDRFLETAHAFGLATLTDTERYGLALTLGGGEVRLLDLTAAYGALANEGRRAEPYLVERVRDGTGAVLYERAPAASRTVTTPEVAWLLGDILRDRDARIPGFGYTSPLDASVDAAVKTGTTTGFRDNWAIGFTPGVVVGAWVGNADGGPMLDVSGVAGAGPIWRGVIEAAAPGRPLAWPAPPAGLVRATVCNPTGLAPGAACPSPVEEWFLRGTEPRAAEAYFVRLPTGELAVDPPPEARAWAADAGLVLAPGGEPVTGGVRIVAPVAGAVLYRAPELARQEVLIRATAAGAVALTLFVDGIPVGEAPGPDLQVRWALLPGLHAIRAVAELPGGEAVATSTFEVRP